MPTYEEMIGQAVRPGVMGAAPQPLQTGAPLIDDSSLQAILSRALTTQSFQPSAQDASTARFNMGMALMQPRMPGESVAGNVGKAMGAGVGAWDAGAAKARGEAVQNAQLALGVDQASQSRQNSQLNREVLTRKFPTEMARLEEELKQLRVDGKIKEYQETVARFKSDPTRMLEEYGTDQGLKKAQTAQAAGAAAKSTADAAEANATSGAKANYYNAYADYMRGQGRQTPQRSAVKISEMDNGTAVLWDTDNGYNLFTPGMGEADARKRAEREVAASDKKWWQGPTFTPDKGKVDALVRQYMAPVLTPLKPGATQPTAPTRPGATPAAPKMGDPSALSGTQVEANIAAVKAELAKSPTGDRKRILEEELASLEGQKSSVAAPAAMAPNPVSWGRDAQGKPVRVGAGTAPAANATPTQTPASQSLTSPGRGGVRISNPFTIQAQFVRDVRTLPPQELKEKYEPHLGSLSFAQKAAYRKKVGE